ncbi:MAG: cation transporter [Ruminococcaceae bacterium]|nr:cation transporter [Oscillospiraceae bacterium]
MKSDLKILVAFLMNFLFSIAEFIGGFFTHSVAISSDALHDLGDSLSIGISYILEKISKRPANSKYTYGFIRFSVLGSLVQTAVLFSGSVIVIYSSILRIINPVEIDYTGMIVMAVFGVVINFAAMLFTHGGKSLNQKAVSLHMLEDVLGWIVVLIGAVIMKFTDISYIDPILSIGVALFSLSHAIHIFIDAMNILLMKAPDDINSDEVIEHLKEIDGVEDVHHLHIWTFDGFAHNVTVHIVTDGDLAAIKHAVRQELAEHGITHSTIEIERSDEHCDSHDCHPDTPHHDAHHHHHHHYHN